MKKQILIKSFLAAILLIVASCSGDDDTVLEKPVLVKKITETINFGSMPSETTTTEFTYDSNSVLLFTTSGTDRAEFIYSGNKVTKSKVYRNGALRLTNNFFYDGNFLTKIVADDQEQSTTKFTYVNGVLSSMETGYYNGGNYVLAQKKDYVFNASNVSEVINKTYFFGESIGKLVYTYDVNPSPLKNLNPYLRLYFNSETLDGLSENNPLTRTAYYPVNSATTEIQHYDILYLHTDFPIEIRKITASNFVLSEAKIEYQ